MSITTYAELQTAVADFINRDDLTAIVPTFITLAEADMARRVRHWKMEARLVVSYDAQFEDIPADWVETISLYLTDSDGPHQLDLISRADMMDRRFVSADTGGRPSFYSMSGGQFELYPTPDEAYPGELLYIQTIPALADGNTSNWLLATAPDAYLYGALVHTAPYLKDDARIQVWAALYQSAIDSLNTASKKSKNSGVGLRMKIRGLS
jgi:hypothetical protein